MADEEKEPDDQLQFDLVGQVGRMSVGVNLPFKKVALDYLPAPIQPYKPEVVEREDQIAKAKAMAKKVSMKTHEIQNEVAAYQQSLREPRHNRNYHPR